MVGFNKILPNNDKIIKYIKMNQFAQEFETHPNLEVDIPTKIMKQIQTGHIKISEKQKPLIRVTQSYSSSELENHRKKLIERIRLNKDKTFREIAELELKQKEFKEAIRSLNKSRVKKQRSSFTEQEKNKIKMILKQTKVKDEIKKKQHQQIMQTFTNYLKKQQEEEEELIENLRQQHKRAVEHNLVSLQMRKKKRQQSKKQVSRRMLELKQKKYIHLTHIIQDQQAKNKEEEVLQQRLEQIKQRFKLDFNQIVEHQKKCQLIANQKSAERKERYKTENSKYTTDRKYSKSIFYNTLQEEEKNRKIEEIRKLSQARQVRDKITEFKELVKAKYMPRKSQQKSATVTPDKKQSHVLSFKERLDQGNEYLKYARSLKKSKNNRSLATEPQIARYADYLKTLNKKAKRSGTVQQFRSIINKEDSIDYPSAEKAKYLVEEIEAKSKKTKDDKLLQSIQNKIDLLKVLL